MYANTKLNHGSHTNDHTHLAELILPVRQELVNIVHSILKGISHPNKKIM